MKQYAAFRRAQLQNGLTNSDRDPNLDYVDGPIAGPVAWTLTSRANAAQCLQLKDDVYGRVFGLLLASHNNTYSADFSSSEL